MVRIPTRDGYQFPGREAPGSPRPGRRVASARPRQHQTAQPRQPNRREQIRLAVGPARPSIRSVDLDNEHPCLTEMSSQRGAVGAGALNADSVNLTVALQPLHEGAITPRRCGKLTIAELAPEVIDHSGMMALSMRVHATGDTNRGRLSCWSWLTSSVRSGQVGTPRSGSLDKPVMGAFCAGSYEVTPAGRSRATTSSTGPTDRPKDSNRCQAYGESDPAEDVSHILTGLRDAGP